MSYLHSEHNQHSFMGISQLLLYYTLRSKPPTSQLLQTIPTCPWMLGAMHSQNTLLNYFYLHTEPPLAREARIISLGVGTVVLKWRWTLDFWGRFYKTLMHRFRSGQSEIGEHQCFPGSFLGQTNTCLRKWAPEEWFQSMHGFRLSTFLLKRVSFWKFPSHTPCILPS